MPDFDTGVSRFIKGVAEVENNFPVDHRGNPGLSCYHCRFFHRTTSKCGLNGEICDYPEKYLGARCPLYFPEGVN